VRNRHEDSPEWEDRRHGEEKQVQVFKIFGTNQGIAKN
jgi:hypothetical protein